VTSRIDSAISPPTPSAGIPRLDIDPFGDEFLADPFRHYSALREAGPVVHLARYDVFAMARFDEVNAALKDAATFCSGRGVGLSDFSKEAPWRPPSLLLETDPPVHDVPRRIMNKIVSLSTLRDLRPRWAAIAAELVQDLSQKRQFDAVLELSEVFPLRIFPDAIGIRHEGREHLLDYAAATFNAFGPRNALFHATNDRARAAIEWVNESCRRVHLLPGGWGMEVHHAADRGECTEADAERLVRSFLSAGVDTTINGIGNMMLAFATSPQAWGELKARPELVKQAVEEALRWDSTVQTFFRTTTRATEMAGVRIPADSKALLFLASANRDPARWPEPERFDIRRKPMGHVAFGSGIHQCLGQMVARLEMELVLNALLPRVASIRLAGDPQRRLNNTLHSLASLPVEVTCA
jgi:cytochrome P450